MSIDWLGFRLAQNGVRQRAEAFNGDADTNPGREVAHAGGCACQDQIAGHQGHDGGGEDDQLGNGEDQVAGGSHLAQLITHMTGNQRVRGVIVRLNPGAEGAEGIEAFRPGEEPVRVLQISGGDVVGDGVAEDMVHCGVGVDPTTLLANHNGNFGLMLHLFGLGRQDDRAARGGQAAGRLEEEQRDLIHRVVHLSSVRLEVTAHADDLGGLDGRQERDRIDGDIRIEPAIGTEGVTIQLADMVLMQPAIAG